MGAEDFICEGLRRRIRLRRALGERRAEGELIARLKARASASGEPRWQAEALRAEANYEVSLSQYEAARAALERALDLYRSLADIAGQVSCHCLGVEIAVHQSRPSEAEDHLERADVLVKAHGGHPLLVQTLRATSATALARQEYGTARSLAGQMLDLCRAIGEREGEADAHSRLATTAARLFHIQEAREHYARAAELYEMLGKRQGQAAALLNAGMLAINLGRHAEGDAMMRQAEALFAAMDDRRGLAISALNLSASLIYQGKYAEESQE